MVSSTIVVALVLLAAGPDAAELVRKLASEKEAERQQVSAALEALGRDALPALRAAARSDDPKLRERARELKERLEAGLLIKPTLIKLDFQDRPLTEVVKAIGTRTGFRLALEPANDGRWESRRVTLNEAQPLSFWETLDRLSEIGRVRHDPGFAVTRDDRGPVVRLREGSGSFPRTFSGPFRVNLLSARRGHDLQFGPEEKPIEEERIEPEEPELERFEVQVQVFAEPHLRITLNGAPKELRARDDFDQDLVPPPAQPTDDDQQPDPTPPLPIDRESASAPCRLSIVQFPIALRAPDRLGTTIERLEGFIPLQVATRQPDPLVVPLADAAGKTFSGENVKIRFAETKPEPTSPPTVAFFITLPARPPAAMAGEPPPDNFPEARDVDSFENHLDVLDAEGRPLYWTVRALNPGDDGELQVTLEFSLRNGKAVPSELRYYGLTQAAVEVPFKFTKIPMP
jgi:hypothetical protein